MTAKKNFPNILRISMLKGNEIIKSSKNLRSPWRNLFLEIKYPLKLKT